MNNKSSYWIPGTHVSLLFYWHLFISYICCNGFTNGLLCTILDISPKSVVDYNFRSGKRSFPYWPMLLDHQCQRLYFISFAMEDWKIFMTKSLLGKLFNRLSNNLKTKANRKMTFNVPFAKDTLTKWHAVLWSATVGSVSYQTSQQSSSDYFGALGLHSMKSIKWSRMELYRF